MLGAGELAGTFDANLLDTRVAAVELMNVLQPTVCLGFSFTRNEQQIQGVTQGSPAVLSA
jgi:hypothetical protein